MRDIQAFPSPAEYYNPQEEELKCYEDGMSLRDYFAAKTLPSIIQSRGSFGPASDYAVRAYEVADAMLEARGKVSK